MAASVRVGHDEAGQADLPERKVEWNGGAPVNGFKLLRRLSFLLFVVNSLNLVTQAYVASSVSSTHDKSQKDVTASAVWAPATAIATTLYLLLVSHGALNGLKYCRVQLALAVVVCTVAWVLQHTGMIFSVVTAANIAAVKSDQNSCYYFSKNFTFVRPKDLQEGCGCDPTNPYDEIVARLCCCCRGAGYSSSDTTHFFDVSSCTFVFDYLYPATILSAVLYGLSFLLLLVSCLTGCMMCCCRCYRCSEKCGPFPIEGDSCFGRNQFEQARYARTIQSSRRTRAYEVEVAAALNVHTLVAPAVAGYPNAPSSTVSSPTRFNPGHLPHPAYGAMELPSYADSVADTGGD